MDEFDAARAAAAHLLLADSPVVSVNGNAAALVPDEVVQPEYLHGLTHTLEQ